MKVELTEFGEDRKEFVQIDPWDTWNMCDDLALIILPMLKQLKETNHGAGATSDEDVPEHLRSTNAAPKENEWDTDSLWFDRWNWIMDEMIWAFEQIVTEEAGYDWKDRQGYTDYHNRISNGTRLFGVYYRSLWD